MPCQLASFSMNETPFPFVVRIGFAVDSEVLKGLIVWNGYGARESVRIPGRSPVVLLGTFKAAA